MLELSVSSKGQKITLCEWTNFRWCPIQCAWFFTLWVVHRLILEHNSCRKMASFLPWSSKLLPCQIFALYENWKLAVCCPNFMKISKPLKCVYQNWRIFLLKTLFFKAQFCSCEGQNTKVLCQFYDWGRSHSQDFTSAMKKGWSLLSQSFQTEIS